MPDEAGNAYFAGHRHFDVVRNRLDHVATNEPPSNTAKHNRANLAKRSRSKQYQDQSERRYRGTRSVRAKTARHPHDRLGDNRNRNQLQSVQQSRSPWQGGDTSCAISKQHQQNRRRQGEANPGCETSQNAAPHQTNAEAGLARCWSRQELGEGDKIGVGAFT